MDTPTIPASATTIKTTTTTAAIVPEASEEDEPLLLLGSSGSGDDVGVGSTVALCSMSTTEDLGAMDADERGVGVDD